MTTIRTASRSRAHRGVAVLLAVGLLVVACDRPDAQSKSAAGSTPDSVAETDATDRSQEIDELIEKLAISDQPAIDGPVFTPTDETPPTDKRVIAYEAAARLTEFGMVAFPQLLARRDDERQSVAFRRVRQHSVGLACYCIVEDEIYNLPRDYRGSFYRTGSDGKDHERPYFMAPGIFNRDTVDAWLQERKGKSLPELQIEVLEWLIAQEESIGFASEQDREDTLGPLQRQVVRVRAQLDK